MVGCSQSYTAKRARESAAQPCHHPPVFEYRHRPPTADCSRLYLYYYLNIKFPHCFKFSCDPQLDIFYIGLSHSFNLLLNNFPSSLLPFTLPVSSVFHYSLHLIISKELQSNMSMQKPWLFKYRSSEWFIVLTVAVAAFTVRLTPSLEIIVPFVC